MYKTPKERQLTFDGFNQSCGMKLNPKDEYVILADMIDWAAVEAEYSALFKSRRGRPAASARMALGSLIIQKRANPGDRKLVTEKVLRKKHLAHAKSRKRTAKRTRSIIRAMPCAVKRNMAFVDGFLGKGGFLEDRDMEPLATIRKLYARQKEMFDGKRHRVAERIVGVTQPYVRPIVRGKVKDPVEFGAKYDVGVDERGHARLEYVDFEPYNECTILQDVVNRYKERTGHCPKRVLVDLVYRTRENRAFCEERGMEMRKRKPGRKPKDAKERRKPEKKERRDDAGRIEVERFFSVEKRCCGAGLIMTKLSKTTLGGIALSVLVANLFGVRLPPLFLLYFMDAPDGVSTCHMLEIEDKAA